MFRALCAAAHLLVLGGAPLWTGAQTLSGPNDFPELQFTPIPGAPRLSPPKLIMAESGPVKGEGMGWASPAVMDWDGDGLKDLLIGEFSSGLENEGRAVGNLVRVYLNRGTGAAPSFADEFQYARGIEHETGGTPLSVWTWCCLGFTPEIHDLDGDGYLDLLTGQYERGEVTWFRGSPRGFHAGVKLTQTPDNSQMVLDYSLPSTDPRSPYYWLYTAASFGDMDRDGDLDMVVGGRTLRISENVGTGKAPKFGVRKALLGLDDQPLMQQQGMLVPRALDWDGDGSVDLLVTQGYHKPGDDAVMFYRGVHTPEGKRFEAGKPLFTAANGGKALPGSWLHVYVTDWNNDGINDLLIGTSVATRRGRFDSHLSWRWESETGISKVNSAYYSDSRTRRVEELLQNLSTGKVKGMTLEEALQRQYGKHFYLNLAHQGYVYVMLGQRP